MPDAQPLGKWTPSKEDQDDLDAIDAAIARMRRITTQDPYRLTIPQHEQRYRHFSAAQAELWLTNAPFQRGEHETTQYLTYHFHEPGKDTYVLESSWHEEEPKVNGNGLKPRPAPGATTPNGAPKKKLTLDAYRKQKSGAVGTPERDAAKGGDAPAKQPAVKGPIERVKVENEEILAAVESEAEVPAEKDTQSQKNELKRKRQDETATEPEKGSDAIVEPPPKKTKPLQKDERANGLTKGSAGQDTQKTDKSSKEDQCEESGMPPRLSPGMPPKLSPPLPTKLSPLHKAQDTKSPSRGGAQDSQDAPALPSRLSPTLPDNIEKTLQARTHPSASKAPETSAPNSTSKDKDHRLTPIKNAADEITKRKSPAPRNGFRANSSSPAVRSDAEDRTRPKNAIIRAKTPERKRESEVEKNEATKPLVSAKTSLVASLKYKKARKGDILRILKMPPRPDKSMSQPPDTRASEEAKPAAKTTERRNGERKDTGPVKGVAQKIGPVKKDKKPQPQPAEKKREDEKPEKQPEKREEKHKKKQPEKQPEKQLEKPPDKQPEKQSEKRSLPDDERTSSPTKRRKAESSENRKEPSTPAQREVGSPLTLKSGLQATPSARKELLSHAMRREQSQDSSSTHATPPGQDSTPSIVGSQPNGIPKAPSSQPSNKTPKQQVWETEQKRLETLGRELKHAASAYLNASQSDTSSSSNDQKLAAVKSIESFLCYLLAFSCLDEVNLAADPKQSPSYTTWRSLHGFYGFVKRNTEPFPSLCGLSCSLGVVYTARILEIAAHFPNDGPSRASLLETHATLQKAANEAERKLDIDALQDAFPKSWSQRSKKLPANEKLDSTKLGGGFKLPIGLATTPVRAARAGHAMLQEWLERERIDYTLKLKL
ncbi:hypothetical protein M409DRAFT_24580 [Zasmidium cellare ATCC 36951]|uniref:Neurofilament heavy polypeptide n=1 Tax=Zasmidium cellare ATCC 36951 TaxID=1080233 RepID=A0A6A6CIG9_ZASCE|nr:uncharacterized protein M409DRAFT_24580 [Zasmidium cellare ATCC 36951]KAF2165196.1 hypothetical protein M409DRAFT_24580 [Zasmidium cellare ATCC 36951]